MNQKERVISEFEIDFKKSCLKSGLNSTYTRFENGYGFKRPEAASENAGCGKYGKIPKMSPSKYKPLGGLYLEIALKYK